MEWIVILLLIFIVNAVVGTFKKAGKRAQTQQTRRTPGYSPRRQFGDILNQMMEQVGREDGDEAPFIESEFVGEGAPLRELAPSYVPLGGFAEGDGHRDETGCVGGSMEHDLHEGMEFPGHIHTNAARDLSSPQAAMEQPPARARLTGRQARYALIMAEVLDRPVSMRKGGLHR